MTEKSTLLQWLDTLISAFNEGHLVKVSVTKPNADAGDLKSIDVRPILIKSELKLSFTYHHKTRDIVKNHSADESVALIHGLLDSSFAAAKLFTTQADFAITKKNDEFVLAQFPASQKAAPALSHDRSKQRFISAHDKHYLHALGITDATGRVHHNAQDKFRQINKYVEILDGHIKYLSTSKPLRIVDMGAGKGYLTFALYDHVANTLKHAVQVVGVEYRAELVKQCNEIAKASGFGGLRFEQGAIADYDCAEADIIIALHACDTATDDAIAKAMQAGAALIVVAPCCHKQIRREMNPPLGHPLHFLLKHGTYVERMAEMITDGLRAQYMELEGYRTQLFEFISDAHTPKNVMIIGTKASVKPQEADAIRSAIATTKVQFGIDFHALEKLL